MLKARFCQNRLFASLGFENCVQCGQSVAGLPGVAVVWHVTFGTVNAASKFGLCCCVDNPAGWGVDVVIWKPVQFGFVVGSQPGGATSALGAPSESKSTPAEAVLSFDTTVLLMKS